MTTHARARRRVAAMFGALGLALATALMIAVPSAVADGPTTFSNTASIGISGSAPVDGVSKADTYPSSISVSAMSGHITEVTVTLTGLVHSSLGDLDVMVVAPGGENLVLLSDAGGIAGTASNATMTFDDDAAIGVPSGAVGTGTYAPTDASSGAADVFPDSGVTPSSATTLAAAFNGIANPNGTWKLFIVDDTDGSTGVLTGGWSLTITTSNAVATTTALTSNLNPATVGDDVTFTATVNTASGDVNAGSVTFYDGASVLAAAVSVNGSGVATFTTDALSEGTHQISASYGGTAAFEASDSDDVTQVVQKVATATTVSSNLNPSLVDDPVTFTATVTSLGVPVATGSVTFYDGAMALGGPVSVGAGGVATLSLSTLTKGSHSITAAYGGTSALASSTSSPVTQVVGTLVTTTELTSTPNPALVGELVTYTATVAANGAPVTSGLVLFENTTLGPLGPVPVNASGVATVTTGGLAAGSVDIVATYLATGPFDASSDHLTQVVGTVQAVPGGPYTVAEGGTLTLAGSGGLAGATYSWDLDNDGVFGDATGASPTLSSAQLETLGLGDGPATHTIGLRVALRSATASAATTVAVTNVAPTTTVEGDLTPTAGVPFTIKVGAVDPSAADMAGTFVYTVDWGDGTPPTVVSGPADPPVTHTYAAAGTYSVVMSATDSDGDVGPPLTVTVTAAPADVEDPGTGVDGDDGLSSTGTESLRAGALAVGLALFGVAVVAWSRRRT